MLAAVLEESRDLNVRRIAMPHCPPGGLLIAVSACAICGSDLKTWSSGEVKFAGSSVRTMNLPRVMGHELSGVVVETDHPDYAVDDRVSAACVVPCGRCYFCVRGTLARCENVRVVGFDLDGAFAEFMPVDGHMIDIGCISKIPETLSAEVATLAEPLSCVLRGHDMVGTSPDDVVAIIGSGPIGCLAAEVSVLRGCTQVFVAGRTKRKIPERITTISEVEVLFEESDNLIDIVMQATDQRGAGVVMVCASSQEAQKTGIRLAANGGRVNLFAGLPAHLSPVELDTNLVHYRELVITGTHGSAPTDHQLAVNLLSSGRIADRSYISSVYRLEEFNKAADVARERDGIKTVVVPNASATAATGGHV